MRPHRLLLVVPFLLALVMFASLTRAEGFEWAKSLTEAFETGNEKGKLVAVVASPKLTDEGAASVSAFLEDVRNGPLASVLVGVRLTSDKADDFCATYGIERLPVFAVLHPDGRLLAHRAATEKGLVRDLAVVVSAGYPPVRPQQLPALMENAANALEQGQTISGVLAQQIALRSLDALIEQAKNGGSSASSGAQQRQDPKDAGTGESNSGEPGGSNSGGDPAKNGKRNGSGGENVSSASWGNLPPKLREDVSNISSDEIPNAYRELVEEYFKSLMSE